MAMDGATIVARAGLTGWMLFMSVLVAQVPVAGKGKKAATAEKNDAPLAVRVTPRFALVGAWVQTAVRVTPDADNRLLRIMVDSEDYFRSSDVQLDGAYAARTHYLRLKDLPAGEYSLLAVVYGSRGERARMQHRFQLWSSQECDSEIGSLARTAHPVEPDNPTDLRQTFLSVCGK